MNWYDHQEADEHCKACGWKGKGRELVSGDSYDCGVEKHCPACDNYFGLRVFPLLRESMNDLRAPESDKQFAEIVLSRIAKKEAAKAIEKAAKQT